MISTLLTAFGIALILEGLLPFANPQMWRDVFAKVAAMKDGQVRWIGMMSMIVGIVLVTVAG